MEVVSVVKYLSRCTQLLLPQQWADVQQGASSPAHWLFTQPGFCSLSADWKVSWFTAQTVRGESLIQVRDFTWIRPRTQSDSSCSGVHVFTWLTGNKLHMELNWKIQYYYIIMIILIIIIIIIIHSVDRMNWDRRCHSCLKLNLFY